MNNQKEYARHPAPQQRNAWGERSHHKTVASWETVESAHRSYNGTNGFHNDGIFRPRQTGSETHHNTPSDYEFEPQVPSGYSYQANSQPPPNTRPSSTTLPGGYPVQNRPSSVASQNSLRASSRNTNILPPSRSSTCFSDMPPPSRPASACFSDIPPPSRPASACFSDMPPPSRPGSVCSSEGSYHPFSDSELSSNLGWQPSAARTWSANQRDQGVPAGSRSYGEQPVHSRQSSTSSFDIVDYPRATSRQSNHDSIYPPLQDYIMSFPEYSRPLVMEVTQFVSKIYQDENATLRGAIQSALTTRCVCCFTA